MAELEITLSVLAIASTVVGLLYQQFAVISGLKDEIAGTKERLAAQETKMDLIWQAIEKNVVKMLKASGERFDALMDKAQERQLSEEEAKELKAMIENDVLPKADGNKRLGFALVLSRLDALIYDFQRLKK